MSERRLPLLLALLLAPLPALGFSLAELQPLLAAVQRAEAQFVEERHLAVLEVPLSSRGTLSYRAPDFLQKAVAAPQPGSFTVEGERLTVEQAGERRVLDLAAAPQLKVFTESFRAVLAGDFDSLDRLYRLSLEGERDRWILRLQPRAAPLSRFIEEVTVAGSGAELQRFTVLERGGDRSTMHLEPRCRDADC